ncbi:hypothetical protein SESBI_32829, partial [Sesbania bispinosa]
KITVREARKKSNLKVVVYDHPNNAEQSSKEAHNKLNLHDQRVSDTLLALFVHQLHQRQNESIQSRSRYNHKKTNHILPSRLTNGTIPTRTKSQNDSTERQQHDGVHRVGRELVPHKKEREDGSESEVRSLNKRSSGHGKTTYAASVEVIVEAGEDADDGGGDEQRRFHGDKGNENDGKGSGFEEAGEPHAFAAVDEVKTHYEWASRGAYG